MIFLSRLYLPVFEKEEGVTAFFSTKEGASPKSPYYNENVLKELSLESCRLIWPEQVHEARVAVIKGLIDNWCGTITIYDDENQALGIRIPRTDGLVTNVPNVLLTTVHADCLAVFFYDPKKKVVGVVHAGWRGTVKGISINCVQRMVEEYGSCPENIISYISPGISKCCFETGIEVYEAFQEKWDWVNRYTEKKGEKFYLDLKAINQRQLSDVGVKNIQVSSHCTCCEGDLFCSYRGEHGTPKRMGAGICLNE